MAITHLLEDFSSGRATGNVMSLISEDALDDQRLASFEKGYSAGWDDALEAQSKDQARISGNLANSINDLSFTYQEALAELTRSVQPVFQALVNQVLPKVMVQTLGLHIVEQLCDMARDQATGTASLIVPLGDSASLSPILAQDMPLPVKIIEDANMCSGQAYLRLGTCERKIDARALMQSIHDAVDAFTFQTDKDIKNG